MKTMSTSTMQLFSQLGSFQSIVGVNRNSMNMHDWTYSVAGTWICQLPLVWGWMPYPLVLNALSSGRVGLQYGFYYRLYTLMDVELSMWLHAWRVFWKPGFTACAYTPVKKKMSNYRSYWESEFLRWKKKNIVDFVFQERSLGFSQTLNIWSEFSVSQGSGH